MKRNKLLSIILLCSFFMPPQVFAEVSLDDVTSPKEIFYRLGTTDVPENKVDVEGKIDVKPAIVKEDKFYSEGLTYADLSIKKMSLEVSKSIDVDYNEMLEDLSLLWQGAATKSDTIKFAIYKLSNPDKDKPDSNNNRRNVYFFRCRDGKSSTCKCCFNWWKYSWDYVSGYKSVKL